MSSAVGQREAARTFRTSAGEVCRHILSAAQTGSGRFVPVTVRDLMMELMAVGFPVNERDVEGLLRGLVAMGEVVEIDEEAGFRWIQPAA